MVRCSPSAATAPIVQRPFPPRSRGKCRAHGPTLVRGLPWCYICQRKSRGGRGGDADGQPDGIAGNGGSRRSGQVSLADLCFLVLAAGLAAGVVRGAREVWGTGLSRWDSNGWSPTAHFERTAGLAVEVASIWLALILRAASSVRFAAHDRAGVRVGSGSWG